MVFHNEDILPFEVLDKRLGFIGSHLLDCDRRPGS